ncbi:extracellular solute-binding protein [bacterium]|nr:extracellular solute-binding protein [bacterium]
MKNVRNHLIFIFIYFFVSANLSGQPLGNPLGKPSGTNGDINPCEIELWEYPRWLEPGNDIDRFAWVKRQLKLFQIENPQIKVKLTELSWNRGDEKLKIAALGGAFPDIAPGTVPLLFIQEGLIEPIDSFMEPGDAEDYLPAAKQAFTVGQKMYGWPWYLGGQLLYANRAMFASAGVILPLNGRWTNEEFVDSLRNVKMNSPKPNCYPLGLYFQKYETANFPFAFQFGGDWITRELKFVGDSEETLKGLSWIKELIGEGLVPPDTGGRTSNDIWTGFGRENRIACAAFGLWGVKALTEKYPMDFEIMHFPAPSGKKSPAFLGISGLYIFHRDDANRVKAAMRLARFLTSAKNQRELSNYTQFPTRKSSGNIYSGNRHMSRAWEILQEGRTVIPDPRWGQIDEEIEGAVQKILLDRANAKDAMEHSHERVNSLIARAKSTVGEDIRKGSWIGKLYLAVFPLLLIFAIILRQVHLIFLLPALTVLGLFLLYPLLDAMVLAFRDYRLDEVGGFTIQNFRNALHDPKFLAAIKNTGLYTIVVVPANVLVALIVASLIQGLPKSLKGGFRAAYYLPGVASVVVTAMVWRWLYNSEVGLFNTILRGLHLPVIGWLTDPGVAFYSILLTGVLRSPGGAILIYLAALGNIPKTLYESADIDGATWFQKWFYITVPALQHTTMFLLITGTIDALQVFAQVLMLTDGGPGDSTEVVVHRIYTAAFRDFDFGAASAMALLLFIAIMVVTLLQRRLRTVDLELA